MEKYKIMKTKTLFLFFLTVQLSFAQSYKIIDDPAIVGQHKRMVFEKWGDWYPKPKYRQILWWKVQTNWSASRIWGYNFYGIPTASWFSPPRNKRYKNGKDIRPLKSTGLQNQRYGVRLIEKNETEKIKNQAKELRDKSKRDFAHWTSMYAKYDPLWLIYYKKMLKPLKQFPEKPQTYRDWQLENDKIYQRLKQSGGIANLQEQLDVLKQNYKTAHTVDMPRGKRILLYHKTLLGWRKFIKKIKSYNRKTKHFLEIKPKLKNKNNHKVIKHKSDEEIVNKVMKKYQLKQ